MKKAQRVPPTLGAPLQGGLPSIDFLTFPSGTRERERSKNTRRELFNLLPPPGPGGKSLKSLSGDSFRRILSRRDFPQGEIFLTPRPQIGLAEKKLH